MTETDTTDLVARLREWDPCWPMLWLDTAVPQAAATHGATMVKELREALIQNL